MRQSLERICNSFIENRNLLRGRFKWESSYIYPVCANIFCAKSRSVDLEEVAACKALLKSRVGLFSNFRGNLTLPIVSMLASGRSPENRMDQALENYRSLKKYFWGSEYLALSAFLLADMGIGANAEERIARGREIYNRMKKEHPFLTSAEDCVYAVLMAFSELSDEALVADMEACYQLIKKRFRSGNAAQSVSHVLALSPGTPEEKTERLFQLYEKLRADGRKYGKHYELSTLAAVSVLNGEADQIVRDILDADAFLARQKGYGFWGVGKATRLMHASMLVSDDYCARDEALTAWLGSSLSQTASQTAAQNAVMTSTLAMLAAQQAAMCAVISSSVAVSSAAATT